MRSGFLNGKKSTKRQLFVRFVTHHNVDHYIQHRKREDHDGCSRPIEHLVVRLSQTMAIQCRNGIHTTPSRLLLRRMQSSDCSDGNSIWSWSCWCLANERLLVEANVLYKIVIFRIPSTTTDSTPIPGKAPPASAGVDVRSNCAMARLRYGGSLAVVLGLRQ